MKYIFSLILFLTSCQSKFYITKPLPSSRHFLLIELSQGVWAAINNDSKGHAICNAGIIDLGNETLVYDPFMNLDAANDLKNIAFKLTKKPVTLVVNSHYHNDHVRGNQLFENSKIISTHWTREKIESSEPEELKWEKENAKKLYEEANKMVDSSNGFSKKEAQLWLNYYEGMYENASKINTVLPNLTFNDSLWIHGENRSIQLIEFKNGHTHSDVVLLLNKEKIIFTGDLLFSESHPWLGDGIPIQWVAHLKSWIENPEFQIFVPGHGKIGDKKTVEQLINYITILSDLYPENAEEKEISNTPIPFQFDKWKFSRFFIPNLKTVNNQKNKL